MRHVRMLGLCLVAAVAVAAIAATSAMALPEWGKCEEKAGGKYSDSNCTKKAKIGTGTFEFKKGKELKNVHFEGGNVGSGGVLVTRFEECYIPEGHPEFQRLSRAQCAAKGGEVKEGPTVKIECESEHNTGETEGTKKVNNISVKFLGCKIFGSTPCSNGPNEGEVQVNPLKGELGYINKAEKKVGLLLTPKTSKGEFAKFNCAGVLATVVGVGNEKEGAYYTPEKTGGYDGIISPITPVNTMTSKYTQVFTVLNEEHPQNVPSKFEGKHIDLLEDYVYEPENPEYSLMWSQSAEEITNENTAEEAGEIKA